MSNVVDLNDFRKKPASASSDAIRVGLIPIEFAMGIGDRERCL